MKRIALCLLLGAATAAHAEFLDGNKLLARLKGDAMDYVNAIGYVTGVYDTMQGVAHCPPNGITAGQVGDMVKQHLEATPELRHRSADIHVVYVLKRAWPCAEQPKRGARL